MTAEQPARPGLVECHQHGDVMCFVQRDGTHIPQNMCNCKTTRTTSFYSVKCPVDLHRDITHRKQLKAVWNCIVRIAYTIVIIAVGIVAGLIIIAIFGVPPYLWR